MGDHSFCNGSNSAVLVSLFSGLVRERQCVIRQRQATFNDTTHNGASQGGMSFALAHIRNLAQAFAMCCHCRRDLPYMSHRPLLHCAMHCMEWWSENRLGAWVWCGGSGATAETTQWLVMDGLLGMPKRWIHERV